MTHRVVHGLRRAAPMLGLGILLELLAIPAIEDLDSFLRVVGYIALVIAALIVIATVFGQPSVAATDRENSRAEQ